MKKEYGLISAKAVICVILIVFVRGSMNSRASSILRMNHISIKYGLNSDVDVCKCMPSTTNIKSLGLNTKDYKEPGKQYRFIKDLSLSKEQTTDMIIVNHECTSQVKSNHAYVCFYSESNEHEETTKKYIIHNSPGNQTKSVFIIPYDMMERDILMARVEAAEDDLINQYEAQKIEAGINYALRIISLAVCKKYVSGLESDTKEAGKEFKSYSSTLNSVEITDKELESMIARNPNACGLLNRVIVYNEWRNWIKLQTTFQLSNEIVKEILNRETLLIPNDTEEAFDRETRIFIDKTISNEENCSNLFPEDLQRALIKDTMTSLNLLSRGQLNPAIEKSLERIKEIAKRETTEPIKKLVNRKLDFNLVIDRITEKTLPWNKYLIDLLNKRLMKTNKFTGSTYKLMNEIKKENYMLIKEAKERKQDYYKGQRNIKTLKHMLETHIFHIMEILDIQKSKPFQKNKNELETKQTSDKNENIIEILSRMAVEYNQNQASENETKTKVENTKKQILSIVSEIEESISSSRIDEIKILEVVRQKKQQIVYLIFKDLLSTNYEDANTMETHIKQIVRIIIDVVVDAKINPTNPKLVAAVKEEVKKNEKSLADLDQSSILISICEIFDKFWYKDLESVYVNWASNNSNNILHYLMEVFQDSTSAEKWIVENSITPKLEDMRIIYQMLCCIYNHINTMKLYDEIWKNPVSLVLTNSSTNSFQTRNLTASITYKSETDGNIYEKEINFTQKNLKAFENAKTIEDIEKL